MPGRWDPCLMCGGVLRPYVDAEGVAVAGVLRCDGCGRLEPETLAGQVQQ